MSEPELEVTPDDRPLFRPGKPARSAALPIVLLVIAAAAGGYYLWRTREAAPRPAVPAPAAEAPPAPQASAAPEVEHPVESVPSAALPALGDSDAAIYEVLSGLFGGPAFTQLFHPQDIVRRFVAAIDNLPRQSIALRVMPIRPVGGPFLITGTEGSVSVSSDNAARYTPYVRALETVDARKLVAAYTHFYPLFQQAYAELGYPSRYFNDRVFEVIDHLLATPDVTGPIALVQPKVLYEYADPELQKLSAGQKILLRMGRDNEARVKAKLREIRRALMRG